MRRSTKEAGTTDGDKKRRLTGVGDLQGGKGKIIYKQDSTRKAGMSMVEVEWPWSGDPNARPAIRECARCGGEIYGGDSELCAECEAEIHTEDRQRDAWLDARKKGIGASEASCILGLNPWKTNLELWEEKTGRREAADLSGKPAVEYGKLAEKHLRALFCLDFPQYIVNYDEFGMIANCEDVPWLFATLDGDITERATGRKGILEVKTTEIQRNADWSNWDGRVPDHYYPQVLHQLLATGYDFVVLKAQIKYHKDGVMQFSTRHYTFEREACQEDMDHLLAKEIEFWRSVCEDKRPALILPEI